jgi:hypothetical protein
MIDDISIVLEKLYKQELSFTQTTERISNLLLEKVNKDIYNKIKENSKNEFNGRY